MPSKTHHSFAVTVLITAVFSMIGTPVAALNNDLPFPESIRVNGTVAASVANGFVALKINLLSATKKDQTAPGAINTYTVHYANTVLPAKKFDVVARWSLGKNSEEDSENIETVTYVPGSATLGLAGAPPIIDLQKRTVTWRLKAVPADGMDHQVSFQLKNSDTPLAEAKIFYDVEAQIVHAGGVVPAKIIHEILPPQDSNTIQTPRNTTAATVLQNVMLTGISLNTVTFRLTTNQPTTTNIYYGKETAATDNYFIRGFTTEKDVALTKLLPDTTYYLQFTVTDQKGRKTENKEYFTVHTAKSGVTANIQRDQTTLLVNGILLQRGLTPNANHFIIPRDSHLTILASAATTNSGNFWIKFGPGAKHTSNVSKPTIADRAAGWPVFGKYEKLSEYPSPLFIGNSQMFNRDEQIELILGFNDANGNLLIRPLATLNSVTPFLVVDQKKVPVAGARISLARYKESDKIFSPLSSTELGTIGPLMTDGNGQLNITLSTGRYRLNATAVGFKEFKSEFNFDPAKDNSYPTVILTNQKNKIGLFLFSLQKGFFLLFTPSIAALQKISAMPDFINLNTTLALSLAIFLTIIIFWPTKIIAGLRNLQFLTRLKSRFISKIKFIHRNNQTSEFIRLILQPLIRLIFQNVAAVTITAFMLIQLLLIIFIGPMNNRPLTGLGMINLFLIIYYGWLRWCVYYDSLR